MLIHQIQIYSRNEDTSAISLQKFTDDEKNYNYPTYTFCFEDSNRGDMYLKFPNADKSRTRISIFGPIDNCPYYNLEENKLFCSNTSGTRKRTERFGNMRMQAKTDNPSSKCDKNNLNGSKMYNYDPPSFIDWTVKGKKYLISTEHYRNLLMGTNQKYVGQSVHHCDEIKFSINDISKIHFDEETIDIKNYLRDFSIKIENGTSYGWIDDTYEDLETSCLGRQFWGYGNAICGTQDSFKARLKDRVASFDPPFKKVYQDPTKICYSPKLKPEWYRKQDHFTIDITELKDSFLKSPSGADSPVMTFHIHMKGQFMRSIGKEHLSLSKFDLDSHCSNMPDENKLNSASRVSGGKSGAALGARGGLALGRRRRSAVQETIKEGDCYGLTINFDISQVTLLKNRPDANSACNKNLKDEDFKIMEMIVNDTKVNCVPMFWTKIRNFPSFHPLCLKDSQYMRIRELLVNFTLVSDVVRSKFEPPCEELMIENSNQRIKGRKVETKYRSTKEILGRKNITKMNKGYQRQYLDVKIRRVNNRYQMIKNNKEFTIESCLSGIGGFIGILIGLSLRQIPEILCLICNFLCNPNRKTDIESF